MTPLTHPPLGALFLCNHEGIEWIGGHNITKKLRRYAAISMVAQVGARWNELVSELERWHEFGKAREMVRTLA